MILTLLYALVALLALSAIIFLHELGHLLAALWVGMKVEVFSIGFGKPIFRWKAAGLQWQIGWIPIGGYVRIAGMAEDSEPFPGSYQAASPIKRMFVVAMGPLVNLVLAWFLFAGIWAAGGQLKPFAEVNQMVGWVDPSSEMVSKVAPGDLILEYDGRKVHGSKEHLYAPMLATGPIEVSFEKIDYDTRHRERLKMAFKPYAHPEAVDSTWKTLGILAGAKMLAIQGFSDQLPTGKSWLAEHSVHIGEHLIAVNGQRVFSDRQLQHLLNDGHVVLTVERGSKILNVRLPTYPIMALALSKEHQLEMGDWHYESKIQKPLSSCLWISYCLTPDAVVERNCQLIDPDDQIHATKAELHLGDRILAIQGQNVSSARDLLQFLQEPSAVVYLLRAPQNSLMNGLQAQEWLMQQMMSDDLKGLLQEPIGPGIEERGSFVRIPAVKLARRGEIASTQVERWISSAGMILDDRERTKALEYIEKKAQEWVLGVQLSDLQVVDNPTANEQFASAFGQITRTFNSLVTGQLSPRWVAGPVGMVTVITQSLSLGLVQALQWMAIISLNLGIFNLIPLPIFDGGRLVIDGFEALTGKKMNPRILDALTYLLVTLLIALALMATYWDVWRLWALWSS